MKLPPPPSRTALRCALLAAGCLTALAGIAKAADGAPHILTYFHLWPWTGSGGDSVIQANYQLPENGGTPVNFAFINPLINVNVSNPAAPNTASATPSYFGITNGSGLGVHDTTAGYFNRGEQFSLQANHKVALRELQFDEYTGDEVLHIAWTKNSAAQSTVLTLGPNAGGRIKGANIIYSIPATTQIQADADTPIRITNVSASTANSAGRLRLVRMMVVPVFNQAPTYTTGGTDGYEQMFGVNLAGGDSRSDMLPGVYGFHYEYPRLADWDYYNSKGLKLVRLPFRWERIQRVLGGPLYADDLNLIDQAVAHAEARGMKVILDMHNYARYKGGIIGSAGVSLDHFENVWERIALHFKGRPGIYGYGLSNEPNGMGIYSWPEAAQAGADGIRNVDPHPWIIVGGEHYSSSSRWVETNPDLDVQDPSNRVMYEAHTYFDNDTSGHSYDTYDAEFVHPYRGVHLLEPFVRWLKQRNARGFLGEYAAPNDGDPRWLETLHHYLAYAGANGLSGTYWLAGKWSADDTHTLHPSNNYTVDKPQMAVISQNYAYGYVRPEVIVDNLALANTTGWTPSTSTAAIGPFYGSNYLHDGGTGNGSKSVLFVPSLLDSDFYEVATRWTSHSNRSNNVPVDVISLDDPATYRVNQKNDGGIWHPLGTHAFAAGTSGGVQISNDGITAGQYVVADAVRLRKSIPVTIILDNNDPQVTYPGWTPTLSTSTSPVGPFFGENFAHDNKTDKGLRSAIYTPNIAVAGKYEVFIRWTSTTTNRSDNVPVTVTSTDGTSPTIWLNQQQNGGQWMPIGTFKFAQGTAGSVKISNTDTTGRYVIFDAVRFHKR